MNCQARTAPPPTATHADDRLTRLARPALAFYWIALAVATHWPRLQILEPSDSLVRQAFGPDKIIHATAFAMLMLGLYLARPLGRHAQPRTQALLAMLIAVPYALLDEYTQQWFGRNSSVADAMANVIGILGMYLILTAGPAPRPRKRWPTLAARVAWLVLGPGLAYLTLSPHANPLILRIYQLLGLPLGAADKIAHVSLAMLLLWLLALAAPAGRSRPRLSAAIAIVAMGLAGSVIELLQHHTGRGFSPTDIQAHQTGVLIALGGWTILRIGITLSAMHARSTRKRPGLAKRPAHA